MPIEGGAVEKLARFVHATRFEHLPAEVVEKAKMHTLDTLGAGLAGSAAQVAAVTRDALLAAESPGPAICWGTQVGCAPPRSARQRRRCACVRTRRHRRL
jgi:2-methylcitrate dehydratase PrpD